MIIGAFNFSQVCTKSYLQTLLASSSQLGLVGDAYAAHGGIQIRGTPSSYQGS